MGNEQLHNDHLFQAAKQHLQNHSEPTDGMDWSRMSRDLDKLPRGGRQKWSFSLNSVLALVGVAGLALGGYALLGGHSSAETKTTVQPPVAAAPKALAPATTTNPAPAVTNTGAANPPAVATNDVPSTTTVAANNTGTTAQPQEHRTKKEKPAAQYIVPDVTPEVSTTETGSGSTERTFSDLLFGDQIDPKHGPVFETQENTDKLANVPPVDPKSLTYFDGAGKPIHIKGDTSTGFTTENGAAPKKKQRRNKKQAQEPPRDQPDSDNGAGN